MTTKSGTSMGVERVLLAATLRVVDVANCVKLADAAAVAVVAPLLRLLPGFVPSTVCQRHLLIFLTIIHCIINVYYSKKNG